MNDKKEAETQEDLGARFEQLADQRESALNKNDGESLSVEDLSEIYIQVKGEHRDHTNMALNTRDKKGDIADYLESRRPFGSQVSQE